MPQSVQRALRTAVQRFETSQIETPRLDAEMLLADLLGVDRLKLRTHSDAELTVEQEAAFGLRVDRRAAREPVAHILGYRDFHRYRFRVTPAVLIPRPETEHIVDYIVDELRPARGSRILDLCTGSGCIGLTLLKELERAGRRCHVTLTDLSEAALDVARENLTLIAPELIDQCALYCGDLDDALPESERANSYAVIVSNPPYIAPGEAGDLAPEVRDHEPALALFHADPPALYRRIFAAARALLTPNGTLVLGPRWGAELLAEASSMFTRAELRRDYAGIDRMLIAGGPRSS